MTKKIDLKALVSELGSQEDVAQLLGITQGSLSSYLSGRWEPSAEVIIKLCILCDLEYLPQDLFPKREWSWLYGFIKMYNKNG